MKSQDYRAAPADPTRLRLRDASQTRLLRRGVDIAVRVTRALPIFWAESTSQFLCWDNVVNGQFMGC